MKDDSQDKTQNDFQDKIITRKIEDEIKESYISYAMSVIAARALPDVRDGLKPVHRRILHAMNELNLDPNKAYKKSARIVGDVMGKYHPHGDTSIYDAMVRLAQDFSMRYMLVDGHGNFGSIDGDSAAAQRYTEARLSHIAIKMLDDIEKDTVDFVKNYDGELWEPSVLPSRFPNLLANGSSGIAVGMATNIPPHNICELVDAICEIIKSREENLDLDLEKLLEIIKGPDFPTGAFILGTEGIKNAYKTGRGKILMRANALIEKNEKTNREEIIITELPYQVNKARLIEKIAELVKEKKIDGIADLRDESDRNGIRILIEIKRDGNAKIILNQLYKFSQLQETFGVIMLVLVNNEPKVLNLREILDYYIEHQKEILTRRTKFDLAKALARQNILSGYLIALDNIQEILNLMRESSDASSAKNILCEKFNLNQEQATAISEMKLRSLTGLEREKIKTEFENIKVLVKNLNEILNNESELYKVLREELLLIKNKYGDARRTKIIFSESEIINQEDLIANKANVITITKFDYIKRILLDNYKTQNRGGRGVVGLQTRETDVIKNILVVNSHDNILYLTNYGRAYKNKAYEIPESSRVAKGTAIVNLLNLKPEEKIAAIIPIEKYSEQDYLIMITRNGLIVKTKLAPFERVRKQGMNAISFKENDELICALKSNGKQKIFIATKHGMGITFLEEKIRATGRNSYGVRAIRLINQDIVIGAGFICENTKALFISNNGYGKCVEQNNFAIQNRGGQGKIYYKVNPKRGEVIGIEFVEENDEVILINSSSVVIRIKVSEISTQGRYASGVKLINLSKGASVIDTAKISSDLLKDGGNQECEE